MEPINSPRQLTSPGVAPTQEKPLASWLTDFVLPWLSPEVQNTRAPLKLVFKREGDDFHQTQDLVKTVVSLLSDLLPMSKEIKEIIQSPHLQEYLEGLLNCFFVETHKSLTAETPDLKFEDFPDFVNQCVMFKARQLSEFLDDNKTPAIDLFETRIAGKIKNKELKEVPKEIDKLRQRLTPLLSDRVDAQNLFKALEDIQNDVVFAIEQVPFKQERYEANVNRVREYLNAHRGDLTLREPRRLAENCYKEFLGHLIEGTGTSVIVKYFAKIVASWTIRDQVIDWLAEGISHSFEIADRADKIQSSERFSDLEASYAFIHPFVQAPIDQVKVSVHRATSQYQGESGEAIRRVFDGLLKTYLSETSLLMKNLKAVIFGSLIRIDQGKETVDQKTAQLMGRVLNTILRGINELDHDFHSRVDGCDDASGVHFAILKYAYETAEVIPEVDPSTMDFYRLKAIKEGRNVFKRNDECDGDSCLRAFKLLCQDKSLVREYETLISGKKENIDSAKEFLINVLRFEKAKSIIENLADEKLKKWLSDRLFGRLLYFAETYGAHPLAAQISYLTSDLREASDDHQTKLISGLPLNESESVKLMETLHQRVEAQIPVLMKDLKKEPLLKGIVQGALQKSVSAPSKETSFALWFGKQYAFLILSRYLNSFGSFEMFLDSLGLELAALLKAPDTIDPFLDRWIEEILPDDALPFIIRSNGLTNKVRALTKKQVRTFLADVLKAYGACKAVADHPRYQEFQSACRCFDPAIAPVLNSLRKACLSQLADRSKENVEARLTVILNPKGELVDAVKALFIGTNLSLGEEDSLDKQLKDFIASFTTDVLAVTNDEKGVSAKVVKGFIEKTILEKLHSVPVGLRNPLAKSLAEAAAVPVAEQLSLLAKDLPVLMESANVGERLLKDNLSEQMFEIVNRSLDSALSKVNSDPLISGLLQPLEGVNTVKGLIQWVFGQMLARTGKADFNGKMKALSDELLTIFSCDDVDQLTRDLMGFLIPDELIPEIRRENGLDQKIEAELKKQIEPLSPFLKNLSHILTDDQLLAKFASRAASVTVRFLNGDLSVGDEETFEAELSQKLKAYMGENAAQAKMQSEIMKGLPLLENTNGGKQKLLSLMGVKGDLSNLESTALDKMIEEQAVKFVNEQIGKSLPTFPPLRFILRIVLWAVSFIVNWRVRKVVRKVLSLERRDHFQNYLKVLILESIDLLDREHFDAAEADYHKPMKGAVKGAQFNWLDSLVIQKGVKKVSVPQGSARDHILVHQEMLLNTISAQIA